MRFRRFVAIFMASVFVVTSCVPVSYADWEDVVHKHVVVPFTNLCVHAIQSLGDIVQAGGSEIRDIVVDDYEFWTQWIRNESLEYREFVSTLNTSLGSTVVGSDHSFRLYLPLAYSTTLNSGTILGSYTNGLTFSVNFARKSGQAYYARIYYGTDPDNIVCAPVTGTYTFGYAVTGDCDASYQWPVSLGKSGVAAAGDNISMYAPGSSDLLYARTTANGAMIQHGEFAFHTFQAEAWYDVVPADSSYVDDITGGSESRISSLVQALDAYNAGNSYVDNSTTINYFIGSIGSDGSVTDTYSPALYDEETLVFTEPVTGNQYQTKGWIYDYTSRSYYMTLDPGTMYIDGIEVTAVYLVYGDDNVEISYLSGSGATELIRTDTYAYVMVSQSACNINGHTYTYEDVSDPTCTTPGERKYTCSICGNEYAEEIPATGGHAYEYSIYQAATCTADGTGLYTCSTCGDQYTEPITATGHIDQILESVPTVYDEEGIVVSLGYTVYECTVCGDQRRVNDEIAEESQGLISGITSAIVSFAKAAWSAISSGLGKLFSGFADLLGGIFGFFTDTVIGGVKSFFGTLSDDSILGYYQDDTGTVALPEGVGSAMAMIPAFFGGLPAELQAPVIFGIAALFLIAALKLFL